MESVPSYAEIIRRAELFMYIARIVRSGDLPPEAEACSLPRLTVIDRRVFCNGASLDLARRPLMLRLFQAFCEVPDGALDRDALLTKVYGVEDCEAKSARYIEAVYANGVKLISRARRLAEEAFGDVVDASVSWFVFDADFGGWRLVLSVSRPYSHPHLGTATRGVSRAMVADPRVLRTGT